MSILIYRGRALCNVILLELVLLTARRKLSFIIFIISILSPDTNPSLHWPTQHRPLYKHGSDEGEQKLTGWTDGPYYLVFNCSSSETPINISRTPVSNATTFLSAKYPLPRVYLQRMEGSEISVSPPLFLVR